MDFFFLNEAIAEREDNFKLVFSDDSKEEYSEEEQLDSNNEDEMFVCNESNDEDGEQDASFYRSLNNKEEHVKFPNQTRNLEEVVRESDNEYFGEDDMQELFDPENRDEVKFNSFDNSSNKSQAFKKSLVRFGNVDNHFFMLLFTVLCTAIVMEEMFFWKLLKKLWETNYLSN